MYTVKEITDFIELIRTSVPNSKEIFTKGNCTSFARILKTTFPGGKVLHNVEHAVYEYESNYFDVTGEVKKPRGAMPIEDYGIRYMTSLMKNNYENNT